MSMGAMLPLSVFVPGADGVDWGSGHRLMGAPEAWQAWLSLTCHAGCQPVHLHHLLPQSVAAIAQAQSRDGISDQHQP